jgi:hypothetical protein
MISIFPNKRKLLAVISPICDLPVFPMHAAHKARIELVRVLAANTFRETALVTPVLSCLATTDRADYASRIMTKFQRYVQRWDMLNSSLHGIAKAGSAIQRKDIEGAIAWFHELKDNQTREVPEETITAIAKILSVHGICPTDQNLDGIIQYLKLLLSGKAENHRLLIKVFRKLRTEKRFIWDAYISLTKADEEDPVEVTDVMSTVLVTNGWQDRVRFVFERRDKSHRLSNDTAARLIRALSHHASHKENVTLVWEIVESSTGMIEHVVVREAVIGFYLVNSQYTAVEQLLRHGPIENARLGNRVLSKVEDREAFLRLFRLLRNVIDPVSSGKAIDLVLSDLSSDAKNLITVLDCMYARPVQITPTQESRIREFLRNPNCANYRKRVVSLLDMFAKKQTQFHA